MYVRKLSLVLTSIMFDRITASSAVGIGPLPVIWESCQVVLSSRCSYTAPPTFRKNIDDRSDSHTFSKPTLPERKLPGSQPHDAAATVPPKMISSTIVEATGALKQVPDSSVELPVIHADANISPIRTPATRATGTSGRVVTYCRHIRL